ncbi:MAG: hypothetical protein ACOYT7_00105 [Patescibacteria group bacterium]
MPDQNNPSNQAQNPVPGTAPPISQTPPPPVVDSGDVLPPFPSDLPTDVAAPTTTPAAGSAPPPLDIPPVITPTGKPKGKFGGKKVIATILGLLVLVGGLGAGIILVKQQQDIREKAAIAEPCKACVNRVCQQIASPPECSNTLNECTTVGAACGVPTICTPGAERDCKTSLNCPGKEQCTSSGTWGGTCYDIADNCPPMEEAKELPDCPNTDCNLPAPKPAGAVDCKLPGTNRQTVCCPTDKPLYNSETGRCVTTTTTNRCETIAQFPTGNTNSTQITITQVMADRCEWACRNRNDWQLDVYMYRCDEIGGDVRGGCSKNGTLIASKAQVGKTYPASPPTLECGTIQVDVGCFNPYGSYGTVGWVSKSASRACAPSAPPGEGPTAQCLNVKAYDTSWNPLSPDDLAQLKAGDVVRFAVAGTTTGGSFDKARFKINGVQRPEVTQKKPGTEEFYDEYTIPEGITSFSIGAQIHHATLGWSN